MQKSLWLGFLLLGSVLVHAEPSFLVVSDFDDTLKQTNSASLGGVIKSFAVSKEFIGMRQLIEGLTRHSDELVQHKEFVLLSGSYKVIQPLVQWFLIQFSFPKSYFFLRENAAEPIYDYKYRRLLKIWDKFQRPMVLLGDDVQQDPEVYADYARNHPERVKSIYIHRVRGREIPKEVAPFHTAYEAALTEYVAGTLSKEDVLEVGYRLLRADVEKDHLFPDYVQCPQNFSFSPDVYVLDKEISQQAVSLEKVVHRFCN